MFKSKLCVASVYFIFPLNKNEYNLFDKIDAVKKKFSAALADRDVCFNETIVVNFEKKDLSQALTS